MDRSAKRIRLGKDFVRNKSDGWKGEQADASGVWLAPPILSSGGEPI